MMQRVWISWVAVAASGLAPAWGQTHAVKKLDEVTRATAVYEWTGEEGKATASRIVPISLFINGQFQDAAIYMARPVPLALDTGTVYEVRKAGVDAGTLELLYERHLTTGDTAEIDDGWLGYGEFKVKPKETLVAKKQSGPLPKLMIGGKGDSSPSGEPKLESRTGSSAERSPASGSKPAVATKQTPSTAGTGTGNSDADADPDSPTLHRRDDSVDTPSSASSATGTRVESTATIGATPASTQTPSGAGRTSDADPDDAAERPTLKRRTPAEVKASQKQKDSARVIAGNNLNDDPDRPSLHRGSKTSSEEEAVPPLRGLPKDMKQRVAVSDAKDRPEHDFARAWESEDERTQVTSRMESFARQQLATYRDGGTAGVTAATPAVATRGTTSAAARVAKRKVVTQPGTAPSQALNDTSLKAYTLSYGGAATYVYSASSPGANGGTNYVSVVAQDVPLAGVKLALASVTDSSHQDRTPWMRFVDVVDADASNRASLLVELRSQHTRQFALYRVLGGRAEQVFLSGSTE